MAPQCPRVSEQTSSAVGQCHTFPTWQHQQIMTKKSQLIVSASATPDHICIKPNNCMSTSREVRAKCHEAKVERKCQISAVLCHLTLPVVIPSTSIRIENATSFCTTALSTTLMTYDSVLFTFQQMPTSPKEVHGRGCTEKSISFIPAEQYQRIDAIPLDILPLPSIAALAYRNRVWSRSCDETHLGLCRLPCRKSE